MFPAPLIAFSRKEIVMGARLARLLLSLFAVAALAFAGSFAAGHSFAVADGQCSNGGNWDNIKQTCH